MKMGKWWLLLVLVWLSAVAQGAMRVDDLYEVTVPVADKGPQEQVRAMRVALQEILVRVSGLPDIIQHPEVTGAQKNSSHYVRQYSYQKQVLSPQERTAPQVVDALALKIHFDEKRINQLLLNNSLPVWDMVRPATLVWFAVEAQDDRFLLGGSDKGRQFVDALNQHARRRGVPLLYPLFDLQDQMSLSFVDVWGGFAEVIRNASRRYEVESILTGRIYRDHNGEWSVRWKLFNAEDERTGSSSVMGLDELLGGVVDGIANALASKYAVDSDVQQQSALELTVSGVENIEDYARLNKYLAASNSIISIQVRQVEGGRVLYGLEIRGDKAGMVRSFALGNTLAPVELEPMSTPVSMDGNTSVTSSVPVTTSMPTMITNPEAVGSGEIDAMAVTVVEKSLPEGDVVLPVSMASADAAPVHRLSYRLLP